MASNLPSADALVKIPVSVALSLPPVAGLLSAAVREELIARYGDAPLGTIDPVDLATVALSAWSQSGGAAGSPATTSDEQVFICPECLGVHIISNKQGVKNG